MMINDYVSKKYGSVSDAAVSIGTGGVDTLSVAELLGVLLTSSKLETAQSMADRLVREYGTNAILSCTNPNEIVTFYNISMSNATRIVAMSGFIRKMNCRSKKILIRGPEDMFTLCKDMSGYLQEHLDLVVLDRHNFVQQRECIYKGTTGAITIEPKDIFRSILEYNGHSFAIVHNHPSGECIPSKADDDITYVIRDAAELMRIPFIDHIIIGDGCFYSYNKEKRF